jgi:hypothetical protein
VVDGSRNACRRLSTNLVAIAAFYFVVNDSSLYCLNPYTKLNHGEVETRFRKSESRQTTDVCEELDHVNLLVACFLVRLKRRKRSSLTLLIRRRTQQSSQVSS